MRLSLVLDHPLVCEAARHGFSIALVGVEIGGYRFRKIQLAHGGLQRFRDETKLALSDR
jgi:hypothetical protein